MTNGQVTITFNDLNLDKCIEQGLELVGQAKCRHCKQFYSFRIHLNKKEKKEKYAETTQNGESLTTLVPDSYKVSIEFSGRHDFVDASNLVPESDEPKLKPQCVPCSRCTPNCERVRR